MSNEPALPPASSIASLMPFTIDVVSALALPVRGRLETIFAVPLVAPPPPPPVPSPPPPPVPPPPPSLSPPLPLHPPAASAITSPNAAIRRIAGQPSRPPRGGQS